MTMKYFGTRVLFASPLQIHVVRVALATISLLQPAGIYLLKVNNRNTKTGSEIC